ncbi:hypothetical protein FBY31_0253 [Arthrobacter sp. SLBN-100]|uniref:hypothetical protein n=1 Tax=Arthrobacter sp. SLBN-100 TaxID=2768450 RepID=UPI00116B97F8|nr:hypothetical protein [Arthrobacter sp. SLBN-100]TQJ66253.1 hypothetical protein FBY31_0253 [Arthrobacter sp. SLBN-100]
MVSERHLSEQALLELKYGSAVAIAGGAVVRARQGTGEGYGMCSRLTTWEDSRL